MCRLDSEAEMKMKKIGVKGISTAILLIVIVLIIVACCQTTKNNEKTVLEFGSGRQMSYKELLRKYERDWNLNKTEAMSDLAEIGLLEQDRDAKYKLLWVQLPKTKENISGGYIQFLCQMSQGEGIDELLGMTVGIKEDVEQYYNGKIKVWWREDNKIEFVCNGNFGKVSDGKPERLQRLGIKVNGEKELSIYDNKLSETKDYCYSHQTIEF